MKFLMTEDEIKNVIKEMAKYDYKHKQQARISFVESFLDDLTDFIENNYDDYESGYNFSSMYMASAPSFCFVETKDGDILQYEYFSKNFIDLIKFYNDNYKE